MVSRSNPRVIHTTKNTVHIEASVMMSVNRMPCRRCFCFVWFVFLSGDWGGWIKEGYVVRSHLSSELVEPLHCTHTILFSIVDPIVSVNLNKQTISQWAHNGDAGMCKIVSGRGRQASGSVDWKKIGRVHAASIDVTWFTKHINLAALFCLWWLGAAVSGFSFPVAQQTDFSSQHAFH